MSKADRIFKEMCRRVLSEGVSSEGEAVRAHWDDGAAAHTIKIFGVTSRYDLSEEFPAITLRRTAIKSAVNELLWIWQKKSNNIHDLGSRIWDAWADEEGSIGKAYGYQMGKQYFWTDVSEQGLSRAFGMAAGRRAKAGSHAGRQGYWMDQVDKVLYDLAVQPFSRRILTSMYDFSDLSEMGLYPCAYSVTFNVSKAADGTRVLNAVLNQRSQDILTANNWNVCQYAVLVLLLAKLNGFRPGVLLHVIADAHIYDRHIPLVEALLEREEYPAPRVSIRDEITDFYDFSERDLLVEDYQTGEQIRDIPVAV